MPSVPSLSTAWWLGFAYKVGDYTRVNEKDLAGAKSFLIEWRGGNGEEFVSEWNGFLELIIIVEVQHCFPSAVNIWVFFYL